MSEEVKSPNLFLYSLLLPLIWFSFGSLMNFFFPGKRLGVFGLVLVLYAAITPICWYFSRKFARHFSTGEKVRLIFYLTAWAIICEFWVLWYHLSLESTPEMEDSSLGFVLLFTAAMDAFFVSLGVHFIGKRVFNYFLNNGAQENA